MPCTLRLDVQPNMGAVEERGGGIGRTVPGLSGVPSRS
jgi:hypothetical protein